VIRFVLTGLVALCAAGSIAIASSAGTPGVWTQITTANGRNIDEVGVARTSDGVLHVVWKRRDGSLSESIVHTPVSPAGKEGSASTVLAGLKSVGNPDLVALPDGRLRAFFPGLGDTNADGGVKAATAPASGTGWSREGVRISSTVSAVSPAGATVTASGDTVFAYSLSFVLAFHVGLDPAVADTSIAPDRKCCDYFPDVATDSATRATIVAWYSNADGRPGLWARQILPAVSAPVAVPGSTQGGKALAIDQQTPITARLGAPGVYVGYCSGYPTCKSVLVWPYGGKATSLAKGADVEDVNIASAPEGRLWVMWHEGGSKTVFAGRTNRAATRLGAISRIKPPSGTSSIWKLKGDGARGPLDLLASVTTGSKLATWHTQVWPTLSLAARTTGGAVVFAVTDAGDPVKGAKVRYAGRTLTTDASGRARSPARGSATKATATLAAYNPASITVRAG
jgi:hypothetical protein